MHFYLPSSKKQIAEVEFYQSLNLVRPGYVIDQVGFQLYSQTVPPLIKDYD